MLRAFGADSDGSNRWYTTADGGTAIAGATAAIYTTPSLTATTTYYVATVSAAGCESDRTAVTAAIHPVPVVQVGPNITVCSNAPAFNLTGFSPEGGSWAGPGVSAAGVFDPATAGPGTHVLTYSYAAASGCRATAALQVTVATCTGMAEEALASDWLLYPNPSAGQIRVKGSVQERTSMVFRILRSDGSTVLEKVLTQVMGEYKQVFDLKGQAKGLYLLQQISDQGMVTKQFVLQ